MDTEDSAADAAEADGENSDFSYEYPDNLLSEDRERGLSKNDRRFLVTGLTRNGNEPTKKTRANIQSRVRKRIRETIADFWLVMQYLDRHDRDLVFETRSPSENWEMREGVKNTMQFFYRGLENSDLMDFETALTSAIHDAEHDRHRGPVLVETEFEVDVNEQFRVQEAYNKFQSGAPLEPMEVGALLITGRVTDPNEVQRLAKHARGHGLIEGSVSPLAAREMANLLGGPEIERTYSTVAHLPDVEAVLDADTPTSRPSVRGQDILDWNLPASEGSLATRSDLTNVDIENTDEILDENTDDENRADHDDVEHDRGGTAPDETPDDGG